jgi:hypothetical protein
VSRLLASRATIAAALDAGGIRNSAGGQFAAPAVLVEPGDPWAGPFGLHGRRMGRWRLTAIAGRADTAGVLETLADLVDTVDAALLTIGGAQLPTWAGPRDVSLGNVPYAASIATIELVTEEV